MKVLLYFFGIYLFLVCFVSCGNNKSKTDSNLNLPIVDNGYEFIQELLLDAKPGSTIHLPKGFYKINRAVSLDGVTGVTIKGAGMDQTVLSFAEQTSGAEGMRITADSVQLMDFSVENAKGDCIKMQDCNQLLLRNVKTIWTNGASESNGAYGIYPVQCKNVTIDQCEAAYASDAGIYVGQSENVVVKNSYAHHNVAGIEIENCVNSEVYNNKSENNTGGILVFDLPDLELVNGRICKVYNNEIISNNHKNFAPEGNIVGLVPPGVGIILLAAKEVEIFDNLIKDHKTMGVAVVSYHVTENEWKDERYDPFSQNVKIYNNKIERKTAIPDITKDFGKMIGVYMKGKPQDIIYDGIVSSGIATQNPMNICIDQPGEDIRFAELDIANNFKDIKRDITAYACK